MNRNYVAKISLIAILFLVLIRFGFEGTAVANGNAVSPIGEQWMNNRMIAHAMGEGIASTIKFVQNRK
ncbi:hypothetical protein [Paenibacillus silvisoli]|uniref:hypothetical protein n=1 Tax=Paenibacillus silvisoli TaxID=3110539 RepID=UPI0028047A01|nr:hypothetical protein [Paenibacillus silvisoli]